MVAEILDQILSGYSNFNNAPTQIWSLRVFVKHLDEDDFLKCRFTYTKKPKGSGFQDHEMPRGWPFGLGNLNMRLQVTESSQPAAAEPYSLRAHSSGFSSFSSSNLDTEINQSTASFFQDHSTSLGRLIGIAPRERRALYNIPNTNTFEQHENLSERRARLDVHKGHGEEMARGICVPLLVSILVKVSRSKSNSKR